MVRFTALDGWRGLAAVLVALYHLGLAGHFYTWGMVRNSWVFVDFFFVLSGFVLAYGYSAKLHDRGGVAKFIVRRFGRLWPLHIFTLLVLLALEVIKYFLLDATRLPVGEIPFESRRSIPALFSNLILVQGVGFFDSWTWNGPSWSISAEFYTYILFAGLFLYFSKRMGWLCAGVSLVAGTLLMLLYFYFDVSEFRVSLVRCIFEFFAGVSTFYVYDRIKGRVWNFYGLEILLVVALVGLMSTLPAEALFGSATPFFCAIVLVFAFEQGPISRFMSSKWVNRLGLYSYSIYLTHYLVIVLVNASSRVGERLFHISLREWVVVDGKGNDVLTAGGPWVQDVLALLVIALTVAVASQTYKFVEVPCQAYFNRLAERIPVRGRGARQDDRLAGLAIEAPNVAGQP
ncbi:acyltransferase family protein [Methylobacterium sp. J-070]|uniref:acyltransferase family protein n=1 Tax=Methylobacterium sp. J-070 TaxID=2836650 RepID=UPI001FBB8018|nr:acyltransferase [Methylobacterium sp. J-070]MCJ2053849.1 acyltransferase [Methylobacterium sp. J-070]